MSMNVNTSNYDLVPGLYLFRRRRYSAGLMIFSLWILLLVFIVTPIPKHDLTSVYSFFTILIVSGINVVFLKKRKFYLLTTLFESITSCIFYFFIILMPLVYFIEKVIKPTLQYSEQINNVLLWTLSCLAIAIMFFTISIEQLYVGTMFDSEKNWSFKSNHGYGKGTTVWSYIDQITRFFNNFLSIRPPFKNNIRNSIKLAFVSSIAVWLLFSIGGIVMYLYNFDLLAIGFKKGGGD